MCVFMVGGAVGAFVGPVPSDGAVTLLQDLELLVWCWVLVNRAVRTKPEQCEDQLRAVEQHFGVHAAAAGARQREPVRPRYGLWCAHAEISMAPAS